MKLLFLDRDLENDSEVTDFKAADSRGGSCCCCFGIRIPSRSGCVAVENGRTRLLEGLRMRSRKVGQSKEKDRN